MCHLTLGLATNLATTCVDKSVCDGLVPVALPEWFPQGEIIRRQGRSMHIQHYSYYNTNWRKCGNLVLRAAVFRQGT